MEITNEITIKLRAPDVEQLSKGNELKYQHISSRGLILVVKIIPGNVEDLKTKKKVIFSNHSYWTEFFKRAAGEKLKHPEKFVEFKESDLLEIVWCLENRPAEEEGQ